MLGSLKVLRILSLRLSVRATRLTPLVRSIPLSFNSRPSIFSRRSSRSSAMRSMTLSSRASFSVTETLSRTAFSAHSLLRPRFSAMPFVYATISLTTFSAMVLSIFFCPRLTGCAAPILVLGAMAAMSAARVIITPAEAARAPLGETKTTTGISEARTDMTIERMERARPPGVSS